MKSYLQILQDKSNEYNVPLLDAFKCADVPTSTFYRTINGKTELRHNTAWKVMKQLEKLHSLQRAREHTDELRKSGATIDRRKIRAKFKPRKASA